MQILTATAARSEFFDLIKSVNKKHEVFHIAHREGNVVLMSEEEYESLLETAHLTSLPEFEKRLKKSKKQFQKGEFLPMDEVL